MRFARATGEPGEARHAFGVVIGLAHTPALSCVSNKSETVGMDEMIARVSQAAGVDAQVTQQAIGEIFVFLKSEVEPQALQDLMDKIPGAQELAASMGEAEAPMGGGGLMGALSSMMGGGGGIMGLAGKLMALGLGMAEMQTIGRELFAYARDVAGEEIVNKVVASSPTLTQIA